MGFPMLRFLGPVERSKAGALEQGARPGWGLQPRAVGGAAWRAYLRDWAGQRRLLAVVISWANLLKSSPSNSGSMESLGMGNECQVRPIK